MTAEQDTKPDDLLKYATWLKRALNVAIDRRTKNHYDTVAVKLKATVESSAFWATLCGSLQAYDEEYLTKTGYRLFMEPDAKPELLTKPYESLLLKTFRRNVLDNANWPEPPAGGWLVPENWYSAVRDIVRTCIVVKYIDGVDFLCAKLRGLSDTNLLECELSFEAREDGYYAAHFNLRSAAEIPMMNFDSEAIKHWFELQVTTQLQEVIRRMLHLYYERKRQAPKSNDAPKWQWQYSGDEFVANYLGHILHYVEGMIMEVRARAGAGTETMKAPR